MKTKKTINQEEIEVALDAQFPAERNLLAEGTELIEESIRKLDGSHVEKLALRPIILWILNKLLS